jgi:NADH dehydrogenase
MHGDQYKHHVVIVGGGFAGLGCARKLADHDDVHVALIDRNNYHQFQPLLYQVATSQLAPADIAHSLREVFVDQDNVDVHLAEVTGVDLASRTVNGEGVSWSGDTLVLAAGSQPNFFETPGAAENSFPLYSLDDATRLRSRILGLFEQVDRDPALVDRGGLNIVVVGGGPTGVEVAGALGDMIQVTVPGEYRHLDASRARILLLDYGDALLQPFSDSAHAYAAKVLEKKGIEIQLGTGVKQVATGHAVFSDDTVLATRCVVWGGGVKAAAVADYSGLATGPGGRIEVQPDLTLADHPGVYVIGDIAHIPDSDGQPLPQLGSVALQSGAWAADNIIASFNGKEAKDFRYHDKGIMAMIGRRSAIAEVGKHHHEIHGELAHMAWLGVHASLITGTRARIEAFVDWAWDGFTKTGGPHVLDRGEAAEIDWDDDPTVPHSESSSDQPPPGTVA